MNDAVLFGAMIAAFAAGVTAHLAIVSGLAARAPRWRAPVALVVAPLAPYWALRARMRFRAWAWAAAAIVYLIARLAQR